MRRSLVIGLGGLLLAVACRDNHYDGPTVVSAPRAPSSSGRGATPIPSQGYEEPPGPLCSDDLRTCGGDGGCCAPGHLCLLEECVAPGVGCEKDVDCTEGRYCEPSLRRCLPKPELCGSNESPLATIHCLPRSCDEGRSSLVITRTVKTPCDCARSGNTLGVAVQNRGRKTVPAGVAVRFSSPLDDDDAGWGKDEPITATTLEPLLPGQSTDVYVAWTSCRWKVDIERDPEDCSFGELPIRGASGCTAGGSEGGE